MIHTFNETTVNILLLQPTATVHVSTDDDEHVD